MVFVREMRVRRRERRGLVRGYEMAVLSQVKLAILVGI